MLSSLQRGRPVQRARLTLFPLSPLPPFPFISPPTQLLNSFVGMGVVPSGAPLWHLLLWRRGLHRTSCSARKTTVTPHPSCSPFICLASSNRTSGESGRCFSGRKPGESAGEGVVGMGGGGAKKKGGILKSLILETGSKAQIFGDFFLSVNFREPMILNKVLL